MTDNCTITSITAPSASDAEGQIAFASPTAISVRATLTDASAYQQTNQSEIFEGSAGVLRVFTNRLPTGVRIDTGYQIAITPDSGAALSLVTRKVFNWNKGSLSHFEVVLEKAA